MIADTTSTALVFLIIGGAIGYWIRHLCDMMTLKKNEGE
jgi:hypothetical protein